MATYRPRFADQQLEEQLECIGAVLIEGPKWCGKTTTAKQHSNSYVELQDPDVREQYMSLAQLKPSWLLEGPVPRLIDEWQDEPRLWDAVRVAVDRRQAMGQFILTGSNSVDATKIQHSGTGRIAHLRMSTMSLYESGESIGQYSLRELFDNPAAEVGGLLSTLDLEQLIYVSCRGGWPAAVNANSEAAAVRVAANYVDSLCANDVNTIDGVRRDAALARLILRALARNVSTLAQDTKILADINDSEQRCALNTYRDYIQALNRLFVLQDLPPWAPAIRNASAIKRRAKREFCDPSIAVAALNLSKRRLMTDLLTFGFIFECLAIRDLRAYSAALGGQMAYYHDRYDLEADAVLTLADGRYALIEFKLGGKELDKAAEHLLKIKARVVKANEENPQFRLQLPTLMLVITAGNVAYTRPDGVKVVPLAALRD